MAEKEITRVSITNQTLKKALTNIIVKGESKDNLVLFFEDLMKDNHIACEYFINLLLGSAYPSLPEVGQIGYLSLDAFWGDEKEFYANSPYCKNGYVLCIITKVRSISTYNPLVTVIPARNTAKPEIRELSAQLKDFYPEECLMLDKLIY